MSPPPPTPLTSLPNHQWLNPPDLCVQHRPHSFQTAGHPVVKIAKGLPNSRGHETGLHSKREGDLIGPGITRGGGGEGCP